MTPELPRIAVTFVCPYRVCVWPRCRREPNGWQARPLCASAETEAIASHLRDRVECRPEGK